jgi:hypothetical protein
LVFLGEFFTAQESGDVEFLALDENRTDLAGLFESKMSAIGGKDDWGVGERAGARAEFAVEEVVEGGEVFGLLFKIVGIEPVGIEKREDFRGGFGLIHAAAIPSREKGALDEAVKGDLAERVAIGPAKEAFAIDLFGFQLSGFAIEVLNWVHTGTMTIIREFEI